MVSDQEYSLEPLAPEEHPFLEKVDMPPPMEGFRVTDQQRLEDSFKELKGQLPKEHHGALQGFWDNVLGPTIAHGIINPLMDPMMLMGAGRGKAIGGIPKKLPEIQFPSEVKITEAKRGSYSGTYEGTETMPQQQQAFLSYSKSAGLDSNKMLKAIEMKNAGATDQQIYKKLGAEFYEGKWGERVPYSGIEIKVKPILHDSYDFNQTTQELTPTGKKIAFYTVDKPTTLSEVAEHSALFKADPTTKDIKVRKMTPVEEDRYDPHTFGFAEVTNNTIVLRPYLSKAQFEKAVVHEVEHIVQERHGFPQGSAAEMFRDGAYRTAEAQKERSYLELVDKVHQLQYFKGEAKNIPTFTSETVDSLISIAHKGRAKPSALTPDEKLIYQDIKKNGLDKELFDLDIKSNNVVMMDMQHQRNYKVTKGEVGSRAAEAEVGKTAEEVSKLSYKRTLDVMVPENRRIDSPLDVGFPQGTTGKRIQESAGSGIALQHPTYESFLKAARETGASEIEIAQHSGITSKKDFLRIREQEIQQYVEKPVQDLVREIYAKGGNPYSSNAYGPGDKGVWYTTKSGVEAFEPLGGKKVAEGRVTPPDNLKGANDNTAPRIIGKGLLERLKELQKYKDALKKQKDEDKPLK